ncbi:hypothetical protein BDE02_01G119100 [Populus trichocarpa]|nr:hypothetical protein BDE02_01G119100 [Populus trichocarpa]
MQQRQRQRHNLITWLPEQVPHQYPKQKIDATGRKVTTKHIAIVEDKKRQEDELKMQAVENARLKDENESLVKEKDTILSPKLELAANVIDQLKSENHDLKRISDHQKIRLDALTEKIASHDELKSLRDEVARLRENVNIQDPRMQEKKQLLEEHLRLANENRLLELQNEFYCRMIQNERYPGN